MLKTTDVYKANNIPLNKVLKLAESERKQMYTVMYIKLQVTDFTKLERILIQRKNNALATLPLEH